MRQVHARMSYMVLFVHDFRALTYIYHTQGLKLKRWDKLSTVFPLALREQIRTFPGDIVPLRDCNEVLVQENKRWSAYLRSQRLRKKEDDLAKKTRKEEITLQRKLKRNERKRAVEREKRQLCVALCGGLPRSLIPTNIPEKHGYNDSVRKESAVVLGEGSRPGFVKMQACKDMKVFEVHEKYVDTNLGERQEFVKKYAGWGNKKCSCNHKQCKLFSATVTWVFGDLQKGSILRRVKGRIGSDVKDARMSFVHFLRWDESCGRPVATNERQGWQYTQDLISQVLSIRKDTLPAFLAPFCKYRGAITTRRLRQQVMDMGEIIQRQKEEVCCVCVCVVCYDCDCDSFKLYINVIIYYSYSCSNNSPNRLRHFEKH